MASTAPPSHERFTHRDVQGREVVTVFPAAWYEGKRGGGGRGRHGSGRGRYMRHVPVWIQRFMGSQQAQWECRESQSAPAMSRPVIPHPPSPAVDVGVGPRAEQRRLSNTIAAGVFVS
eukprot:SAG25_NODE_281_length_10457_cov_12.574339_5_plen_118_part_00